LVVNFGSGKKIIDLWSRGSMTQFFNWDQPIEQNYRDKTKERRKKEERNKKKERNKKHRKKKVIQGNDRKGNIK